ncbi:glycoside hydrolase family 25 protein [Kineosporia sp. J2-2]|uniref:Glycoside hydrolase family 25 protein n=1 Tax=Kineosporia corallincola TaxID=2835133 RepID=A0ABS5TTK3_9ACTN|nr:glycoside hydrolase family 25 protein [Kineosporia corallincola]MBT0774138.1 glycoside hydrolase family 25 protein [Kineosporia corallincola]
MPTSRITRAHVAVAGACAFAASVTTLMGFDVSHYQTPAAASGATFLIAKASDGIGYRDPEYPTYRSLAQRHRLPFGAYHFLRAGNVQRQAENAYAAIGAEVPLVVDAELGGKPSFNDLTSFVKKYRKLGGTATLLYLPRSYWEDLGRPNLEHLGISLYNARYLSRKGDYPGNDSVAWQPYGGMKVELLQYSDGNGKLDHDAFQGTRKRLCELLFCWDSGAHSAFPPSPLPAPSVKPRKHKKPDPAHSTSSGCGPA